VNIVAESDIYPDTLLDCPPPDARWWAAYTFALAPLLAMVPDWNAFLNSALPEKGFREIRRHARTGRPLGDEAFLGRLEEMLGRVLKPQKPGPKPRHRGR